MRKLLLAVAVVSFSLPAQAGELENAVAKLILDVYNLKQKVAELQAEVERLKERKSRKYKLERSVKLNTSSDKCVKAVRGEFMETPSHKYCLLATVKRPSAKGERYLLSKLPAEAPLYLKKSSDGRYYVYFTLPSYCKEVRSEIPDAYTWTITLSCPEQ
jgi:uncharacterized small protein (DUF1192 family)